MQSFYISIIPTIAITIAMSETISQTSAMYSFFDLIVPTDFIGTNFGEKARLLHTGILVY
jgi:hypothetical protein